MGEVVVRGGPYCPRCGGRDLKRAGFAAGKQQYRCRGCGRFSYEYATTKGPKPKAGSPARGAKKDAGATGTVQFACPHCGAGCWRNGHTVAGEQMYLCRGCGRVNVGLRLWEAAGSRFREPFFFYLNTRAEAGLRAFRRRHGLTVSGALRRILREASEVPAMPFGACVRGRVIRPQRRGLSAEEVRVWAARRLPDLRARVGRARFQWGGEARYRPTVLVVRKVSVALDDVAFAGLVRASRSLGRTHQETVRLLLERAGGGS